MCVRAINLCSADTPVQMDFFNDFEREDRLECLQDAVESIRGRFGKRSITYGSLLGDLKMPGDGREKVKMPGLMFA